MGPMQTFFPTLIFALPALSILPLLAGIISRYLPAQSAGRVTITAAAGSFLISGLALIALITHGEHRWRLAPLGENFPLAISLTMDAIAVTMALLVSFLGFIVMRFSRNYLAGDPQQSRFFSWMSLTFGSVLALVIAGNFFVLLVAWVATSLCLHRLLLHAPERAGAVFAARKKFVISRVGDLCLLGAMWLTWHHFGTWEFREIFAAVAAGHQQSLGVICGLLAACAILKSAQFPFHGWLPDTMETPTPVSAFMHAGIINAGGFLLIRLSPLFSQVPLVLATVAIVGAITAAFGAVVMLAQPSVKRALAYSTIAQMGFMILQCGLGAFALALLHIVAHSLYKAHAFLHAGSTIGAVPRAAIRLKTPALLIALLTATGCVIACTLIASALLPAATPPGGFFLGVLILALTYGLARIWSVTAGARVIGLSYAVAIVITALSLLLHFITGKLFLSLPASSPPLLLVLIIGSIFLALFLFQCVLWRIGKSPIGRWLYIHALNGFYLGTLGNRLLGDLWPRHEVHPSDSSLPLPNSHSTIR